MAIDEAGKGGGGGGIKTDCSQSSSNVEKVQCCKCYSSLGKVICSNSVVGVNFVSMSHTGYGQCTDVIRT